MPFVVVLWLALLQALSLAAPVRSLGGATAGTRPPAAAVDAARRLDARPDDTPDQAQPGLPAAATAVLVRASVPAPISGGGATGALQAAATPGAPAAATARQALRRHGAGAHVLAARGRLLPYFPTAPPGLG